MDALRKLILDKLGEMNLNMSEASIKIGRNHAYLQQFLKRGVPRELGERERERLATLIGVPENELRGTSEPLPAREYNKPHSSVADSLRATFRSDNQHNSLDSITPVAQLYVDRDLPVYGTGQSGRGGALIVTNRAVDYIARPTSLSRVEEAYAMIVTGDSMSPKIENGDTVLINPHLPWKVGDTCIFRSRAPDGSVSVTVKYLRKFDDDTWFVRQLQPRKDFTLKRAEWQVCHVTIGNHFAR